MKWMENMLNIDRGLPPGPCPHCGSETDYQYYRNSETSGLGKRGSLWIFCNACKHCVHFSCTEVPDGEKTITLGTEKSLSAR